MAKKLQGVTLLPHTVYITVQCSLFSIVNSAIIIDILLNICSEFARLRVTDTLNNVGSW